MEKSLVLKRSRKVPAVDTAAFGAIAERFRRAGALERAVELCREGLRKFPDHISARVTLGWSLLDLGKYDDARIELEQVLRRAPDNLAAIRGLAELHDRFEHTLHLPMDGPGQWPPPPESLDQAATGLGSSPATEEADDQDLEMTPAALGIPLWSAPVSQTQAAETPREPLAAAAPASAPAPAPATAPSSSIAASVIRATATGTAAVRAPAVSASGAAARVVAQAAVPAPIAATTPAVTASEPVEPVMPVQVEGSPSASSMSSMREIDFAGTATASVVVPSADEPEAVTVETPEARMESQALAADIDAVSDADIQALIAEVESLDTSGLTTPVESETVLLDVTASGTDDALAAMAEIDAPAQTVAYTSVTAPISVDFDLDAAAAQVAEPLVDQEVEALEASTSAPLEAAVPEPELVLESGFELTAPATEAQLEAEELFEAALEVAAPLVDAAFEFEVPRLAFDAVVEEQAPEVEQSVVVVAVPEESPAPVIEIAAMVDVDVSAALEIEPQPEVVSEVDVAPAIEAVAAAEMAELTAGAPVAQVVSIELGRTTPRSSLLALERLLSKVQARRAQLMTESVA
jgi:hypothetical protein